MHESIMLVKKIILKWNTIQHIELIFGQIKALYREEEYEYIQEGIIESIEALNTCDFIKSYKHTWKIIEQFI